MSLEVKAKTDFLKLIVEKGYSVVNVADELGIHYHTARKLLQGKPVLPATAKKACDGFEISMWDYFEMVEQD